MSVAQPGILFRVGQSLDVRPIVPSVYFRTIENWYKAPVKILSSLFRKRAWPLRTLSGCTTARCFWQCHSRRVGRGWKYSLVVNPNLSAFHRDSVIVVRWTHELLSTGYKMGVSIWDAGHAQSIDRRALSGGDVKNPWDGVLGTLDSDFFASKLSRLDAC